MLLACACLHFALNYELEFAAIICSGLSYFAFLLCGVEFELLLRGACCVLCRVACCALRDVCVLV